MRAIYVLLFALGLTAAACSGREDGGDGMPPSSNPVAATHLATCKNRLAQARKLNVLYDLRFKGGSALAYVGPTWFQMQTDAKESFHNSLHCFLTSGKGGTWTTIEYRDWQTGHVVATTRYTGKLEMSQ